jgi:hypothetical protein
LGIFDIMILFKGYKHKGGFVHFRDITTGDIRAIFFPKTFEEKYMYLGCPPYDDEGGIFKAMEPLVIFMDYKAKPSWCPRFVLRFLHVFGMDKSIVRVRNRWMSNLLSVLTQGYRIIDYKTKWEWYDLRISVQGDEQMWFLSDAIEAQFYREGKREDEKENPKIELQ